MEFRSLENLENTKLPPQLSRITTPLKAISSRVKHLRSLCLIDWPTPYTYHPPQKLLSSTKINTISCSCNSHACQPKATTSCFSEPSGLKYPFSPTLLSAWTVGIVGAAGCPAHFCTKRMSWSHLWSQSGDSCFDYPSRIICSVQLASSILHVKSHPSLHLQPHARMASSLADQTSQMKIR